MAEAPATSKKKRKATSQFSLVNNPPKKKAKLGGPVLNDTRLCKASTSSRIKPSRKARGKRKRSTETDSDSESDLPDTIFPLPEPRRQKQPATKKLRHSSPVSQKSKGTSNKRKGRTVYLEISSNSESEIPPATSQRHLRNKKVNPKADTIEVISSGDEDTTTLPKRILIRTRMEGETVVILSSSDEEESITTPLPKRRKKRPPPSLFSSPPQPDGSPESVQCPRIIDQRGQSPAPLQIYPEAGSSTPPEDIYPLESDAEKIFSPALGRNFSFQALYDQALTESLLQNDDDVNVNVDLRSPLSQRATRPRVLSITYSHIPPTIPLHTPNFFARSVVGAAMLHDFKSPNDAVTCPDVIEDLISDQHLKTQVTIRVSDNATPLSLPSASMQTFERDLGFNLWIEEDDDDDSDISLSGLELLYPDPEFT